MISRGFGGVGVPLRAFALGLSVWALSTSSGVAGDDGTCPECHKAGQHTHPTPGPGNAGRRPGFQGFGLGYHLGYGYGGDALGVGPDGGYPSYGGPGYPHPWPTLRRLGPITPFLYFGGPGYPTASCPNYFGTVGPLVSDRPVIEIEAEPGEAGPDSGYGPYTGTLPYPEPVIAPYTAVSAGAGTGGALRSNSPPPATPNPTPAVDEDAGRPAAESPLGIVAEPAVEPDRTRGLKVTTVDPGSAAEKAGLRVGDVIHSINDYVTGQPAHLVWILGNAANDNVLKMSVRTAGGEVRTITARLR